ncbi:MAG: histone deacetylase [Planctomycetota bacterium]
MKSFYSDVYTFPLPERHRFPIAKYRRLRERIVDLGVSASQLSTPEPCSRERLERVHDPRYIDRIFSGELDDKEQRALGFPWSETLVFRSRCSVAVTVAAADVALREGAGGNLAGGTHHAYPDRAEGFCVFNDVAVATRDLLATQRVERVAVLDCDVHQGNGTAFIFREDPNVFTVSLHGRKNWPFEKEMSDLDIEFDDGTEDAEYLKALEGALDAVFRFRPEIVFFVAGVDTLKEDRLGRLSLSADGLRERDSRILGAARTRGVPVAISLAGGYAEPIERTIEAHATTFEIAESLFPGG